MAKQKFPIRFEKKLASHKDISPIDNIFGESAEIFKAKKIACNRNSILLIGESGTGKELFAQAIHKESRPDSPFVAINLYSIPKSLIESELFGYESGSFTGAERKGRMGKIEIANGSTVFLDKIGDIPLELQPVLLRVLEDQKVTRIGGNKSINVNFRVIAATNKNLLESVKNKEFREDLYFRLAVFKIIIPPLPFRKNDILELAKHFIQSEYNYKSILLLELESSATRIIKQYNWPGNVRQLKNTMYYSVNMAKSNTIKQSDLPTEITDYTCVNTSDDIPISLIKLEERGNPKCNALYPK